MLDSSVALTWCLPGQESVESDQLFVLIQRESAIVPAVWQLEVGNILGLRSRSGHLKEEDLRAGMGLLRSLNIFLDLRPKPMVITDILAIMGRFRLTAYASFYVELAQRQGLRLATFDKEMREAARQNGIALASGV